MILFSLIFFVMIIVVGAAAVLGFSAYLKRRTKRLKGENQKQFAEPPPYRSLFEPTEKELENFQKEEDDKLRAAHRTTLRQNLTERANTDDFTVLTETKSADDPTLYDELFDLLTERAENDSEKTIHFAEFVSKNELPSNETFARNILAIWKKDSSTIPVAKILHVSALTNSAENYSQTIDQVFSVWKKGELKISGDELLTLIESHYWLLSNETRISGAGFTLKRKLAELREKSPKK